MMTLKLLLDSRLISNGNSIEIRDFDYPINRNGKGFKTIRVKHISKLYNSAYPSNIVELLDYRVSHIYTEIYPSSDNPIIIQLVRN